jgi:hypothetical protein
MTEITASPIEPPRRFHFDWALPALFSPRRTFAKIAEQAGDVWLTPLLILVVAALLRVAVAGPLKQAAAQSGQVQYPPDFQFWPPDMQAQFNEAMSATSRAEFVYIFPAILSFLGVWVGWLVVVGLLHLVFTLLGARGTTRTAMNLVAWAGLPFAVRDLVRLGYMLVQKQLIAHPGLSGFAPTDDAGMSLFLTTLLGLVDLYLIWHAALLVLGVRMGEAISRIRAWGGVLVTLLIVLALQSLPSFLVAQFNALNVLRPLFF